jgi:hypothetical protein
MAYQPWNSIFLSQQISHSRLISQKTACRTGPILLNELIQPGSDIKHKIQLNLVMSSSDG